LGVYEWKEHNRWLPRSKLTRESYTVVEAKRSRVRGEPLLNELDRRSPSKARQNDEGIKKHRTPGVTD
jgi:hypothetical protein